MIVSGIVYFSGYEYDAKSRLARLTHERDEALDLLSAFMWEFTKLMTDKLSEFIGKNE